jgi:hypothetical protein
MNTRDTGEWNRRPKSQVRSSYTKTSRAQRILENEMGNHLLPHHSRRANWKTDALHSFPLGDIYVYTADSFQNSWNKYATERARRLTYIYNKLDVGGCWGGGLKLVVSLHDAVQLCRRHHACTRAQSRRFQIRRELPLFLDAKRLEPNIGII